MVAVYTEDEFKTILACSKLYSLKGSILNYDISQLYLQRALKYFSLGLVKENFNNLDDLIDASVRKAFNNFYKASDIDKDEIIRLKEYAYSFLNKYLMYFNLKEYQILLGPNEFVLDYEEASLKLFTDAVYKQANRKGFLHVVCFYPFVDEHVLSNDFFINLKAYFYKKYASTARTKSNHSEITIHLLSAKSFNKYRSKTKDFAFVHKQIQIKDLLPYDPSYQIAIVNSIKNLTNSIPFCQNKACSKRSKCFEQLR